MYFFSSCPVVSQEQYIARRKIIKYVVRKPSYLIWVKWQCFRLWSPLNAPGCRLSIKLFWRDRNKQDDRGLNIFLEICLSWLKARLSTVKFLNWSNDPDSIMLIELTSKYIFKQDDKGLNIFDEIWLSLLFVRLSSCKFFNPLKAPGLILLTMFFSKFNFKHNFRWPKSFAEIILILLFLKFNSTVLLGIFFGTDITPQNVFSKTKLSHIKKCWLKQTTENKIIGNCLYLCKNCFLFFSNVSFSDISIKSRSKSSPTWKQWWPNEAVFSCGLGQCSISTSDGQTQLQPKTKVYQDDKCYSQ